MLRFLANRFDGCGTWAFSSGAFVYSTLSHVKYLLLNGDRGIIHCLNEPVYIFK